jgi:hypothetical protein
MRFHVELRTDDPDLEKVLSEVGNKAKFVKKALKYYITTKRGKETFRIMSKRELKDKESPKSEKSISPKPENIKEKIDYDLDRFL